MSATDREHDLVRAFVGLSDTLVGDYDAAGLLQDLVEHCVGLLRADAAGILLTDPRGGLQVVATSSDHARLVELFQQQTSEGPCVDAVRTGAPVNADDLVACRGRWPRFVPAARRQHYQAVDAVPLRLREEVIGALNLFRTRPGPMPDADLHVARALADTATIGILSERTVRHHGVLVAQLEAALGSRVIIEQAKGLLVGTGTTDMDQAFTALRGYARRTQTRLTEVAAQLVSGDLAPATVLRPSDTGPSRQRR